jgi:hypothetical protein
MPMLKTVTWPAAILTVKTKHTGSANKMLDVENNQAVEKMRTMTWLDNIKY